MLLPRRRRLLQRLELRPRLRPLDVHLHHEEVRYTGTLAAALVAPQAGDLGNSPAVMGRKEITPSISHQKA